MSTRCNIVLKQDKLKDIVLYHHHDGYPEGVGSILLEYCKLMTEKGWYMDNFRVANDLIRHGVTLKDANDKLINDDEYELTCGIHGDIDYLYIIVCQPYEKEFKPRYICKGYAVRDADYNVDINHMREVNIPLDDSDPIHVQLK